ncbi:MAG: 23S rRNA (adenine(2503)-C(2))-methyltransferase RlmN, partial [Planctomycetota bacterium]
MPDAPPYFFDQTPESLAELFVGWGLAGFRAKQVMQWVYAKGVADPQQMSNLSQHDRDLLAERMRFV